MGKGDIRTKKGKIYRGTYGNTRKKQRQSMLLLLPLRKLLLLSLRLQRRNKP